MKDARKIREGPKEERHVNGVGARFRLAPEISDLAQPENQTKSASCGIRDLAADGIRTIVAIGYIQPLGLFARSLYAFESCSEASGRLPHDRRSWLLPGSANSISREDSETIRLQPAALWSLASS